MTQEFFREQIARLQQRFGPKAFDEEFNRIIAAEVKFMSEISFVKLVNHLIGSRPPSRPPLLVAFKEGRLNDEREALSRASQGAAKSFNNPALSEGLKSILARDYNGARTALEAVHIQILRNQIKKANEG
jgi:hypothetical protein